MAPFDPTALAGIAEILRPLEGAALIERACALLPGRVAVISSFGAESAPLLDLVAGVDPTLPVLLLDTGELFDETLPYAENLAAHLGLGAIRVIRPTEAERAEARDLWTSAPDRCCHLRKVAPLARAVAGFTALIDGRRRAHGFDRADLPTVTLGETGLKLCPLAGWSDQDIAAAFTARGLPPHPLVAAGYRSIGCWPCTRPVAPDEPARAGRWAGAAKTECGIHLSATLPPTGQPKGRS